MILFLTVLPLQVVAVAVLKLHQRMLVNLAALAEAQ
jgi:hypothetical protein